jgi:hypothetical protein
MNAADLLSNMVRLYAAFDSYIDTGYVTTTIAESGLVHRRPFSTLYRKPRLFRFAFYSPHPFPPLAQIMTEHVVGFDGIEGYRFRKGSEDQNGIKMATSLNLAVAGASGISSGSAHTIGKLLFPDIEGRSVLELVSPRCNAETEIDGTVCHSITAVSLKGGEQEFWIEKDTLLLRKVIRVSQTARSEEVRENIQVNEALEDRLFGA